MPKAGSNLVGVEKAPKDEYGGKYKDRDKDASPEQKFGASQNPVQHDALPAKGLKKVGG